MSDVVFLRTESCGGLLGNFAETSYKGHETLRKVTVFITLVIGR